MSVDTQNCPKCNSQYAYKDADLWICPECFFEWTSKENISDESLKDESKPKYTDANGVPLQTGDTVATTIDLKLGKNTIKAGTKVKNIRLLDDPIDGHDISCKIAEYGSLYLKCSVVKKIKS